MTEPSSKWLEATVEEVVRRTPNIKSFFLRASAAPRIAGQHVDVRLVAEDGYEARRSYSIASSPGSEMIELMVERLGDGEVSPWFHDVVVPGDLIELRGPLGGHFVWHDYQPGPLLAVAGGSGIAPIMSMLRHRADTAKQVPACLVYSVRSKEDMAYRQELEDMAAADPNLRLRFAATRGMPWRTGDFARRLDRAAIAEVLASWGKTPADSYVCGSTAFVEAVGTALVAEGVPASSVRTERYGGTAAATG